MTQPQRGQVCAIGVAETQGNKPKCHAEPLLPSLALSSRAPGSVCFKAIRCTERITTAVDAAEVLWQFMYLTKRSRAGLRGHSPVSIVKPAGWPARTTHRPHLAPSSAWRSQEAGGHL